MEWVTIITVCPWAADFPGQAQEVLLLPVVQAGGGLIQDDHLGGQGQDPGHRQALALALGEGEGVVPGPGPGDAPG